MIEVRKTMVFTHWFENLKDRKAKARIQVRLDRLNTGYFGDVSSVGGGVSELRIFHGPGYRLYFTQRGKTIVILLSGGDKSTQAIDISKAKVMAKQIEG